MHMWVATCVGRLISPSLASGLLKGSGSGGLLHLGHIIAPICLSAGTGSGTWIGLHMCGDFLHLEPTP